MWLNDILGSDNTDVNFDMYGGTGWEWLDIVMKQFNPTEKIEEEIDNFPTTSQINILTLETIWTIMESLDNILFASSWANVVFDSFPSNKKKELSKLAVCVAHKFVALGWKNGWYEKEMAFVDKWVFAWRIGRKQS